MLGNGEQKAPHFQLKNITKNSDIKKKLTGQLSNPQWNEGNRKVVELIKTCESLKKHYIILDYIMPID